MPSFEYAPANGMQYGNGGAGSAFNADGSLKDGLGRLPQADTTGSLKPQVIIDTLKRKLEMLKEDRGIVQREDGGLVTIEDYSETK